MFGYYAVHIAEAGLEGEPINGAIPPNLQLLHSDTDCIRAAPGNTQRMPRVSGLRGGFMSFTITPTDMERERVAPAIIITSANGLL